MILKNVLDLSRSITEDCRDMHELVQNKDISDPAVIKIKQQLNRKMIMLQKIISEAYPFSRGKAL
ncbi:hypothetical protein [Ectobacillus funiculus]|uniref:DUF465 domain-containing protein n=1 Tax=Ectobacillus funiculus TaxID=137993 RepID=A0ABV5WFI1_9BACI